MRARPLKQAAGQVCWRVWNAFRAHGLLPCDSSMKRNHGASLVKTLALALGGVAVVGLAAAWYARRSAFLAGPATSAPLLHAEEPLAVAEYAFEPSPDSFTLEAEPPSESNLTARPKSHSLGILSHDDSDALLPEELGQAFLAGATDTALDEPPRSTAEASGFRLFDPSGDG
jgi:hypothetical protein